MWIKDGKVFNENQLVHNGIRYFNPTKELMQRTGYTWQEAEERAITVYDYDMALEDHIRAAREDRGYTTREPSYYLQSSVPRWAQDAKDWVDFVDQCMLYGLKVQNDYAAGSEVPTLEEFKANLPQVVWTYQD